MHYMLLIYGDPAAAPDAQSPEGQAEYQEWVRYTEELEASGAYVRGDALHPVEAATTVRGTDGGEIVQTDGPFAETKEVLGGYYVVDVPGLDEAVAWARKMPNITYGSVEVRPVLDFG